MLDLMFMIIKAFQAENWQKTQTSQLKILEQQYTISVTLHLIFTLSWNIYNYTLLYSDLIIRRIEIIFKCIYT